MFVRWQEIMFCGLKHETSTRTLGVWSWEETEQVCAIMWCMEDDLMTMVIMMMMMMTLVFETLPQCFGVLWTPQIERHLFLTMMNNEQHRTMALKPMLSVCQSWSFATRRGWMGISVRIDTLGLHRVSRTNGYFKKTYLTSTLFYE